MSNATTVVVALDIGTSRTGYAYGFRADWDSISYRRWEEHRCKTYSDVLLKSPSELRAFGYEARQEYYRLTEPENATHLYFRHFKMALYNIRDNVNKTVKAVNNSKEIRVVDLMVHVIRYLRIQVCECLVRMRGIYGEFPYRLWRRWALHRLAKRVISCGW